MLCLRFWTTQMVLAYKRLWQTHSSYALKMMQMYMVPLTSLWHENHILFETSTNIDITTNFVILLSRKPHIWYVGPLTSLLRENHIRFRILGDTNRLLHTHGSFLWENHTNNIIPIRGSIKVFFEVKTILYLGFWLLHMVLACERI